MFFSVDLLYLDNVDNCINILLLSVQILDHLSLDLALQEEGERWWVYNEVLLVVHADNDAFGLYEIILAGSHDLRRL